MRQKEFRLKTLTDYSDESLLEEMHRVASNFRGQRLTRKKFDELSRVHSTTLSKRFGSWTNALDQAGISENIAPRARKLTREDILDEIRNWAKEFPGLSPTSKEIAGRLGVHPATLSKYEKWADLLSALSMKPVPLGMRYSDEDCFENIVALWTHYGRQPHFAELKRPPSSVGSKAYVLRWGGWRNALAAFMEYVNQPSQNVMRQNVPAPKTEEPNGQISDAKQTVGPRTLSLSLRYKVLLRDRFRCQICGRAPSNDLGVELHVDHIIPWSKGGENTEENLRTLCSKCNLGKGAKREVFQ